MVLYILGLFGLLIINTQKVTDYFKENVLVILYFQKGLSDQEIEPLAESISRLEYVKNAKFVSSEEAAFQYKEVIEKDFVEILGDNPLPSSIEVYLTANMGEVARNSALDSLRNIKGVTEIDFQKDLVSSIEQNKKMVGNILVALAMLLVIVSLILVNNAIRLSVYSKRFLVKSMQLVGATEWFIIKPFVIRSIFNVLIAAVFSMVLTLFTFFFVGGWIQSNILGNSTELFSLEIFQTDIKIYCILFVTLIGLGLLIVIPGTYYATQKYLRLKVDDLY